MKIWNLVRDARFSCRLADGSIGLKSIQDLTDPTIRTLSANRADFAGTLWQLLAGLLLLALKPRDLDDWRHYYENPPCRTALAAALEPLEYAFELISCGPAFFQDLDLPADAPRLPIDALLIDRASESNLHFNHPFERPGFCAFCTALALSTLQLNAPSGGRGIRTSIRGGGPLTTMLLPERQDATLWEALWLNVLPFEVAGIKEPFNIIDVLPWLRPTRTSDGPTGRETHLGDVHPLQVWWSFSRRIRLDPDDCSPGRCDLCGIDRPQRFHSIRARHGGTNYAGPWLHPLTPYNHDPKGLDPPSSIKGTWGRHAYRRWVGLVLRRPEAGGAGPSAATIVQHHARRHLKTPVRLWCFGYEMDNAKARNWYESVLPLHDVPDIHLPELRQQIATALDGTEDALSALNKAAREARFTGAGKIKGHWVPLVETFWNTTEAPFYRLLKALIDCTGSDTTGRSFAFDQWLFELRTRTLQLFDTYALSVPLEAHNAKHLVVARRNLANALHASRTFKRMRSLAQLGQEEVST